MRARIINLEGGSIQVVGVSAIYNDIYNIQV
jgi:hypothetical protein